MEGVRVAHRQGSYTVRFDDEMPNLDVAAIITDQNVKEALGHHFPSVPCLAIPPGESSKSLKSFEQVHSWLIKNGIQRGKTIGVIGGGVVGDLGGFVAATYMRGIAYIQVPTSLLAMVDSSVGGKVGVDLPEGKNLVGAFHPPIEVRVCLSALDTLPSRHFTNGMAEVLKYGFISDPAILDVDPENELSSLVRQCIQIKADIVAADELETNGIRATLNFGHTIGHAIETASNYELLHGEAIAIGMVLETELGESLGLTQPGTRKVVKDRLAAAGLPTQSKQFDTTELLRLMKADKKATASGISFSLLTHVGGCKLVTGVAEDSIKAVLNQQ